MTALVHFDPRGLRGRMLADAPAIGAALARHGLEFGRLPPRPTGPKLDDALATYAPELQAMRERFDVQHIDRVRLQPAHPDRARLRAAFLAEHTHADPEIRIFLDGHGLFHVRTDDGYLGLLCEAGDWISIPAGTPHRFDAGNRPSFDALRLFSRPDGWVASPTDRPGPTLPLFETFVEQVVYAEPGIAISRRAA